MIQQLWHIYFGVFTDDRPFLCQECIEVKHTTRGFRRKKILGTEPTRHLIGKRESSESKNRSRKRIHIQKQQRHSRSLERDDNFSAGEDELDQPRVPLPHTCVARGCDGTGIAWYL